MNVQTDHVQNGQLNKINRPRYYVQGLLSKLWKTVKINEWTAIVFMFVLSLGICVGKLFINYGYDESRLMNNLNKDRLEYFTASHNNDGWFFRAVLSGIGVVCWSWYIIYYDSRIPGINPPAPWCPSNKRSPQHSRLQLNYLMGMIIGVVVFIHMCL